MGWLLRKVRRVSGLPGGLPVWRNGSQGGPRPSETISPPQGRGRLAMRRGASIVVRCLSLSLLAASAGCSWPGARRGSPQDPPTARAGSSHPGDQRAGPGGHRSGRSGTGEDGVAATDRSDPRFRRGPSTAGKGPAASGTPERGRDLLPTGAATRSRLCRGPDRAGHHRSRHGRSSVSPQAISVGRRDRASRRRGPLRLCRATQGDGPV